MDDGFDTGVIEIAFAGQSFRLDGAGGMDLVARQMRAGSYEAPLPLLMMATLLRTPGDFVDVGANTGLYSVMAAAVAYDRAVYSFEPHPEIAAALQRNVELNGAGTRVTIHRVALSDSAGVLKLYLPDQGHGLVETSASLEREFQPAASSIDVDVRRLDDLVFPAPVAVMKVDIEGHEDACLRGAAGLIGRDRPFIFAEVLGPARRDALGALIRDLSYLDFRLRPDMAILDAEVLFDDQAWNHALVPVERLAHFAAICDACGLPMYKRFSAEATPIPPAG